MDIRATNPNEDLQAIRNIMERSSKFLSLSGLSGVFAGVCALAGAAVAWFWILDSGRSPYHGFQGGAEIQTGAGTLWYLTLDAILVLGLALAGAVYFSYRKARKAGQHIWTGSSRRLIFHLLVPLAVGGIFAIILVLRNHFELIAPVMLIFYGLSLVNAGKFTFSEIHYLGLTEIGLGILAGIFTSQGLFFWTIGFGLMHIVYGSVMYYRYER
jgi:hypothetical protein